MLQDLISFVKDNKMIEKGDRIVIGLSGGADSVCLLYALIQCFGHEIEKIIAIHINHGLRGDQADKDELFVKDLCKGLGIEFYSIYKDVRKFASENKLSEEEAGRNIRYQTFFKACMKYKCNKIAIAHNRNDNAETMLFNLFRGAGINGLTGIDPKRMMKMGKDQALIIRPLLNTSRDEIEEYLREKEIAYKVDASNLENDYSRNRIRNQVFPLITNEINSKAIDNVSKAAFHLREVNDFTNEMIKISYDNIVDEDKGRFVLPDDKMRSDHIFIQKSIIMKVMASLSDSRRDLESKHVDLVLDLFDKEVGKQINLPNGLIALRAYNHVSIFKEEKKEEEVIQPVKVNIPGKTFLETENKIMETRFVDMVQKKTITESSCIKWLDYDRIENTVEIRTRTMGDFIQINAQGGRKKIKDYFIDKKIPAKDRSKQLLLADGNHIMWIIGGDNRISERYKIDGNTKTILEMKLIDAKENRNGK